MTTVQTVGGGGRGRASGGKPAGSEWRQRASGRPGDGSGAGQAGVGSSDDGRLHRQAEQLLHWAPHAVAAGFGRLLRPRLGGFAFNMILLAAQPPRLGQTGTAPDLCPRGAGFLSLFLAQLPAIGVRCGAKSRPQAELLWRAPVLWLDIPAPALFSVPHIIDPVPESPTLGNRRQIWINFVGCHRLSQRPAGDLAPGSCRRQALCVQSGANIPPDVRNAQPPCPAAPAIRTLAYQRSCRWGARPPRALRPGPLAGWFPLMQSH